MSSTNARLCSNPHKLMAAKQEEFQMLLRGVQEYPLLAVNKALGLASGKLLYRGETVKRALEWFKAIKDEIAKDKRSAMSRYSNILWKAVESAPPGLCHVKQSIMGSLLDDITTFGLSTNEIIARFNARMSLTQYQRPQAPPKEGNIDQAEKLVAEMGAANSLKRRFARIEELPKEAFIWKPPSSAAPDGVFGELRSVKNGGKWEFAPGTTVLSFAVFKRDVLPLAKKMWFIPQAKKEGYLGTTAAVDLEAPILFQWGHPFSGYSYAGGSDPQRWNLIPTAFVEVTGVLRHMSQWKRGGDEGGNVFFLLKGAVDVNPVSLGLFPETLKSEYHSIRSVIEAYSNTHILEGRENASACGVSLPVTLIVELGGGGVTGRYMIDRPE